MKAAWIALILVGLSFDAAAKRLLVDDTDEFVAYVETESVEISVNTVKIAVLYDYKSRHNYLKWPYWSQRTLVQYDCKDKRVQTLFYAFYAGQMGSGEQVLNGAILPGLWAQVPAGSTVEKFWKVACRKEPLEGASG